MFDNVQRAVYFDQKNGEVDRVPSIAKNILSRKKYKKHLVSSIQKSKSKQTSGSVFVEKIEQVKQKKYELESIKSVNCFLDGYRSYSSKLLSFETKSL